MNLEALLDGLTTSRTRFLRHLEGLPEAAWSFKPYPECKSILETLVHLRIDDEMAAESILTNTEPDYAAAAIGAYEEIQNGQNFLLNRLSESHARLLDLIRKEFSEKSLESKICVWGTMMPLYTGIPFFSSEDFYHAGQCAFIRMAVQPDWEYYGAIYGEA